MNPNLLLSGRAPLHPGPPHVSFPPSPLCLPPAPHLGVIDHTTPTRPSECRFPSVLPSSLQLSSPARIAQRALCFVFRRYGAVLRAWRTHFAQKGERCARICCYCSCCCCCCCCCCSCCCLLLAAVAAAAATAATAATAVSYLPPPLYTQQKSGVIKQKCSSLQQEMYLAQNTKKPCTSNSFREF